MGNSYDNALAETIIGLYKTEVIRRRGPWRHLESVELATLEWVEWFNRRRLFEPIGDLTQVEKEEIYLLSKSRVGQGGLTHTNESPVYPGRFRDILKLEYGDITALD